MFGSVAEIFSGISKQYACTGNHEEVMKKIWLICWLNWTLVNSLKNSACWIKTTDENVNNYISGQLYNKFEIQCTAGQWYSCQIPP